MIGGKYCPHLAFLLRSVITSPPRPCRRIQLQQTCPLSSSFSSFTRVFSICAIFMPLQHPILIPLPDIGISEFQPDSLLICDMELRRDYYSFFHSRGVPFSPLPWLHFQSQSHDTGRSCQERRALQHASSSIISNLPIFQ